MDNPEHDIQRWIDSLKTATYNYWIGLFTGNTILIAILATSTITNTTNQILIFCIFSLIVVAIVCSYLILSNFRDTKNTYYYPYTTNIDETIKNSEQLIEQANILHKKIQKREKMVEYLLIIEAILIIFISATKIELVRNLVNIVKNTLS